MNAAVLMLALAQAGQVVIDVAPAVAVRTTTEVTPSPVLVGNALVPVGGGVLLDAGAQVKGPLLLVGSLAGGVWGATRGAEDCCDVVFLEAAFSFRVGPSARLEWPTSRGTLLFQLGPRYHLHALSASSSWGPGTRLAHGWAADGAVGYLSTTGALGLRVDFTAGPLMFGASFSLVFSIRQGREEPAPDDA
ncbi:MAG: hypothetical protein JNJ54_28260 [Myxococcaceae bacterium]|nr:hypothetical protein [Myxococcaceae bacterium]